MATSRGSPAASSDLVVLLTPRAFSPFLSPDLLRPDRSRNIDFFVRVLQMIVEAIASLWEDNGSSQAAIARHIEAAHGAGGELPPSHPALEYGEEGREAAAETGDEEEGRDDAAETGDEEDGRDDAAETGDETTEGHTNHTDGDSSGNHEEAQKKRKAKRPRRDRKPQVLANVIDAFTKVSESGLPLEPSEVAKGYNMQLGCIVRESMSINMKDIRSDANVALVETLI
ncbi:hypothetical protein ACQ4PT_032539 [Festuca glaucescens]